MLNFIDCEIFRSAKKSETYLYLQQPANFDFVPEELMKSLGSVEHVMDLTLDPKKKLSREDVLKVMENIRQQGYHLQMPPDIKSLLSIHNSNVSGSAWDKE